MALAENRRREAAKKLSPFSPTGSAQEGIAREDQATLAPENSNVARTCVPRLPTKRAAYSPAEFAASCGRHPTWAYRLLYANKLKAVTGLGRILIPATELERVLGEAESYNPRPKPKKVKSKGAGNEGTAL